MAIPYPYGIRAYGIKEQLIKDFWNQRRKMNA
jgi:hypothetical protein